MWKTGIQTYTFHKFTLMEALDRTQALGLKYAEAFFSQELGEGFPAGTSLDFNMTKEQIVLLKKELKKRNIKLLACGVAFYDNPDDWKKFFEFASQAGLEMITAEPKLSDLDMVEALAQEYDIEVAIHNHPVPSEYADPDVLEEALIGRSSLMGVCADVGHWKRSGFEPLETLRRFESRLKVIHFKDLNEAYRDTTWGKGILPMEEMINSLDLMDFSGLISIEYENFNDSQMDDIRQSMDFLKKMSEK